MIRSVTRYSKKGVVSVATSSMMTHSRQIRCQIVLIIGHHHALIRQDERTHFLRHGTNGRPHSEVMPPCASGFPCKLEELTLADGRDSRITGMTGLELDGHVQGVGQGFEGGHPQVAPCLGLGQADFTDPRPRR